MTKTDTLTTQLTPILLRDISKSLAKGTPVKAVMAYHGIGQALWDTWYNTLPEFKEEVLASIAESEGVVAATMQALCQSGDRASCEFLLKNQYGWGTKDGLAAEITGKILTALNEKLTKEEYLKVVKILKVLKF
jgi:hypothetical protein